ncbi:carbohydrate ABC transporter permease [Actinocrinis sp.]|uniref:carbohydrate ABC transporter permease n=1 Tax=Actinocrinis sp. TaxID=1920516 RepID=UPI002D599AA7|nr:carbohydrate ABC transporter permease [Actinocrinis sp.]HZP52895.1 carbohydrate ABC transporter permease [Actinocrinis sp.]
MSVYTARLARNRTGARRRGGYPVLIAFVLAALLMLAPFGLVAMNAVKTSTDYAAHGPLAWPHGLSLANLKTFWNLVDFGQVLLNSTLISAAVAILAVLLSILNAYALGIGRVRGRTWIIVAFLIANLLPQEGLVYPLYYLAKQVGLYDTRTAIIIIFTVVQSAFGTYLLSSVLGAFPREILEAARIDGAGTWRILWRVVVPISRPTLVVLLTFFFIWTWNEFLLPLVFLVSNQNQTVPVALGLAQGEHIVDVTMQAASGLLGILPAIVFFLIFQRTLTRGVTVGAVK